MYVRRTAGYILWCFYSCVAGLYPSDELEVAKVDSLIDFAAEYLLAIQPAYFEKDPAKKVWKEVHRALGLNHRRWGWEYRKIL